MKPAFALYGAESSLPGDWLGNPELLLLLLLLLHCHQSSRNCIFTANLFGDSWPPFIHTPLKAPHRQHLDTFTFHLPGLLSVPYQGKANFHWKNVNVGTLNIDTLNTPKREDQFLLPRSLSTKKQCLNFWA